MWRREDDALLQRIEDEFVLEALWRRETGGVSRLHPRASGLVAMLRALPQGGEIIQEASDVLARDPAASLPNPAGLSSLLRPAQMAGLPGPLLHHLAIFHERVADATREEVAFGARLRALAAWFAMTHDVDYLPSVVQAVLGPASTDDVEAHRLLAGRRPLDALGRTARKGARQLDEASRAALRALAVTPQAASLAGLTASHARPLTRHADRLRARAIDAALAPIEQVVVDLVARNAHEAEAHAAVQRTAKAWHWSGWDEQVERFAVDVFTPVAWTIYRREEGYDELRRLMTPLGPLVDRLAQRVLSEPSSFAYAAPVAQMFVFRSEMTRDGDEAKRLAERALEICPFHRNGRYIVARLLRAEVRQRLDEAPWAIGERSALSQKLDRAASLWPDAQDLPALRERLKLPGG